jgi:hypothetical protein
VSTFPRLEREPVALPRSDSRSTALWSALLDLVDRYSDDWCLIGGQMVFLHALEAGAQPPRLSRDLDVIVDARVRPSALQRFLAVLEAGDFEPAGASPENVAHRFARGEVTIDVMVPEGLGTRADRRTIAGAVTIEVQGGTQALARTELLPVVIDRRRGWVPRPDLLGAVVVKAAAARAERRNPQRHLFDLAFLCSLIEDPFVLRERLDRKDRERLRRLSELADPRHEAWQRLGQPEAGHAAYRLLCQAR